MITEGVRTSLIVASEALLESLLSLCGGGVTGVNVGGTGNESRLADSES
jgi:hypothetical protein